MALHDKLTGACLLPGGVIVVTDDLAGPAPCPPGEEQWDLRENVSPL